MATDVFRFKCPSCGAVLAGKKEWAGRKVRCNKCNAVVTVPTAEESAQAADTSVHKAVGEAGARRQARSVRSGDAGGVAADFQTTMRWLTEGLSSGLANLRVIVPAALIFAVLNIEAVALGVLPAALLAPALTAGFVIILIEIARGARPSVATLFAPLANRRYWKSVGVFWAYMAICAAGEIPLVFFSGLLFKIARASGSAGGAVAFACAVVVAVVGGLALLYLVSRVIWAVPLVVDRGTPVMESFRESWKRTGRVQGGWGLFVLIIILKLIAVVPSLVILLISKAAFQGVVRLLAPQALFEAWPSAAAAAVEWSPVIAAGAVGVFVLVVLWAIITAVFSVPLMVGYRESVPH